MTPNSPEPSMDWRDSNSTKRVLKPLVKVSVPPRMPKSKNRFFAFIKSVLTLSIFFGVFKSKKKKNTKKRRNKNYKKNQSRVNRGNKNQNNRSTRTNNKGRNSNSKNVSNKKPSKPVVTPPKKSQDERSNVNKPKNDRKVAKEIDGNKLNPQDSQAPTPATTPAPTPAQSSTSNVKPTRALNDPRYKNQFGSIFSRR